MSRVGRRRAATSLLACLVGVLLAGPLGASPSTAAERGATDAVSQLGSCLAGGGTGEMLLVLDTSGSLADTDPTQQRVVAARYLVSQLAAYAKDSGAKLDLAVAGFAGGFKVTQDWTRLSPSSAPGVLEDLDTYRSKDTGFETDYWTAATQARRTLAAHASGGATCQAWVWFSDGKYDLDSRDTDAERKDYGTTKPYGPKVELTSSSAVDRVQKAGIADLCRKGGVSDQLRAQKVITLAVGLDGGGDVDFSLMRGVATGSPYSGSGCGTVRGAQSPGEFVLARNIGDLLLAFDRFSDPKSPPVVRTTPLCQGTVCPEGTHQFVLDSTVSSVRVVSASEVAGFDVVLAAPGATGPPIPLTRGTSGSKRTGGADIRWSWLDDGAIQVQLKRLADAGWVGQWRMTFVDPKSGGSGTVTSNLHFFGDLVPAWTDKGKALTTGEDASFTFGLVRSASKEPVDLRGVRSDIRVDAELESAGGKVLPIGSALTAADLGKPVKASLSGVEPGAATLRVSLQVTTASAKDAEGRPVPGTALEPVSVSLPVTIAPPPNYPRVPSSVDFGKVEEIGSASARLKVSGQGCVWLGDPGRTTTTPEGVDSLGISSSARSQQSCVSKSFPVTLSWKQLGSGLASGEFTVLTSPSDGSAKPVPVTVTYQLEMQRPRDEGTFWALLVAITLLGLLIPIGLLYLAKWLTARIPGTSVMVGSVSGDVTQVTSWLSEGALSEREMSSQTLTGTDRRTVRLTSAATARTRLGLGLTEPGHCVVVGPPGVASTQRGTPRGTVARLPLALQDTWVALLDEARPRTGPVEVAFICSVTGGRLPELIADARARVPEMVDKLRQRLPEGDEGAAPTAPASTDEWGNPSSSPSSSSWQDTPAGPSGPSQSPPSSGSSSWDEW